MAEKKNTFKSLHDLANSSSFVKTAESNKNDEKLEKLKKKQLEKEAEKKAKQPILKHGAISVRTDDKKDLDEGPIYKTMDGGLHEPTDDEKARHTHEGTYTTQEKTEEEYEISDEFKKHLENKNESELKKLEEKSEEGFKKVYTQAEYNSKNGLVFDRDLLIKKQQKKEADDIINKILDKKEPFLTSVTGEPTYALTYTAGSPLSKENSDIINTPSMEKKDQAPNNKSTEQRPLSDEDLKLQDSLYDEFKIWNNKLKKQLEEEGGSNSRNLETLNRFNNNPYGWIHNATERGLNKLHNALKFEEERAEPNENEIKRLKKFISINEGILDQFNKSWEKNLPLKLNNDFQVSIGEIKVNPKTTFDSSDTLANLNKFFNEKSTSYKVTGNFQRGNDIYLTLRDEAGATKEISLSQLTKVIKNEAVTPETKPSAYGKEDELAHIKGGEIVHMRVGGEEKGKVSIYKIVSIVGDKVSYIDITNGNNPGAIKLGAYKSMLMNDAMEFYVESQKIKAEKAVKVESKKNEPTKESTKGTGESAVDIKELAKLFTESKEKLALLEIEREKIKNELNKLEKTGKKEKILTKETYSMLDFQKEIKPVLQEILGSLESENPQIKEFEISKSKTGEFVLDSKIKVTGKLNTPVNVDVKFVIGSTKKSLYPGDRSVKAQFAGLFTGDIKGKIETQLLNLVPNIKTHFEKKEGKHIESMAIENGAVVVHFEEKEKKEEK